MGASGTPTPTKPKPTAPKRTSRVPEGETKEARFKRLANLRVPRTLKALGSIANLTGPGYGYTEDQAKKIITDLRRAVDHIEQSFFKPAKADENGWSV